MGVMKRIVFLFSLFLVFSVAAAPSMASVTTEQSTDAEYLINAGYSESSAEDVFVLKNRANGNPIEPLYGKKNNVLVRGWKAFWGYVDPANEQFDRIHHDVHPSPFFSDL